MAFLFSTFTEIFKFGLIFFERGKTTQEEEVRELPLPQRYIQYFPGPFRDRNIRVADSAYRRIGQGYTGKHRSTGLSE
jgi:hypothetical protein